MSSFTFGQKSFKPSPPEKGSFPLDHDGECRRVMMHYMRCIHENHGSNTSCRDAAKEYLACRMDHNLMAKEEWSKLGYGVENEKQT